MNTFIKVLIVILYFLALAACRNQEPRDTESGQGDNFDQNHPMQTETSGDTTATNSTITDPTAR